MPKHNFKCPKCGYKFEADIGMNDPNPTCPNGVWTTVPLPPPSYGKSLTTCGTVTEKDFNWGTSPAAHFQGSGWAKDGYSK